MSESDEVETSQPASTKRRGRPQGALLRVACPTCMAAVGVQCRSESGKLIANGHRARRDLAGLVSTTRKPSMDSRAVRDALAVFTSPVVTLTETTKTETGMSRRDIALTVQSVKVLANGTVMLVGARLAVRPSGGS